MRYRLFAILMISLALVMAALLTDGYLSAIRTGPVHADNRQLVQAFQLTDLALWTGARYTRHLSQADLFSAFQDGVGALEHFPEGALAPLPSVHRPHGSPPVEAPGTATTALSESQDEPSS